MAKGLSQEKLALEAGIDRSYVGRIERGTENVTVSALETLALILNVPVSELFSEFDDATSQPSPLPSGRKPRTP